MKETLTVPPEACAAIQRGEDQLRYYCWLLESGTDEQLAIWECMRAAAIRWDILKARALYPAIHPPYWRRVLAADRAAQTK